MKDADETRRPRADAAADFERDDPALWGLLGAVDEIEPRESFVEDVKRAARRPRPFSPGRWAWVGVAAAAAVLLVMVQVFDRDEPAPVTDPTPPRVEEEALPTEDDLVALELDELMIINRDYFGG